MTSLVKEIAKRAKQMEVSEVCCSINACFPTNKSKASTIIYSVTPYKNFDGVKVKLEVFDCFGWTHFTKLLSIRRSDKNWWYLHGSLANAKYVAYELNRYSLSESKNADMSDFYLDSIGCHLRCIGVLWRP